MLSIARVLVAGGDGPSISTLRELLESAGHDVVCASTLEESTQRLGLGEADVVVLSPGLGRWLEPMVAAQCASALTAFVVLAHEPTNAQVRDVLRCGAHEVLDRAAGDLAVLVAVERAAREGQLRREVAMLRARVGDAKSTLIGRSSAIAGVRELVGRAAASRAPVLIIGEPGTGKDMVAQLVHDLSDRASRPFVTVRCGHSDPDVLERELFGRIRAEGAPARAGLLEDARGGTIVLDDASSLPAALRSQLARVSTSRVTRRVGGSDALPTNVRLVLTSRSPIGEIEASSIDDLLSRFNALLIEVPPLRERRSDIPQLVQHFRQRLATEQGLELAPLASEEMLPLLGHEWSGNVRELEHWVERAALTARHESPREGGKPLLGIDLGCTELTLEQLERAYILHVLETESGHQSRSAVRLGIDRRTLYRKLKEYRGERVQHQ